MRAIGAVVGVIALLGTAILAPFSMSMATAYAADDYQEAMIERHRELQVFSAAEADQAVLPLKIVAADDESEGSRPSKDAMYSLEQFLFSGVVNWGGYKFTYYSQQVLPGPGLAIPGRHVNAAGYVSDGDGYIVLAGDAAKGTVYATPFGYEGKIYDRGTAGNHLDVYIR